MSNTVDASMNAIADLYLMRLSEGSTDTANSLSKALSPGESLKPVSDLVNRAFSDSENLLQGATMVALTAVLLSSLMNAMRQQDNQPKFSDILAELLASLLSKGQGSGGHAQPGMEPAQAFRVLERNFDKLSGGKDSFTDADLKKAAADGSNPELQRAAQTILNSEGLQSKLSGSDFSDAKNPGAPQGSDHVYSKGDLMAALAQSPLSVGDAAAIRTLKDNSALLFDNGKKELTPEALEKMASKDWKPPEGMSLTEAARVQESAKLILSKPELRDQLDSAYAKTEGQKTGSQLDGKIDLKDVDAMMKAHQIPN